MKNHGKSLKLCERVPGHPRNKKKILQNLGSTTARNLVPNYNIYGTKYTKNNTHISPQPELTNLSNSAVLYILIRYYNGLSINEILLVDCTKHELNC